MRRSIPLLLAGLAWLCMVTPWRTCHSDCRDGMVQPLVHDCHVKGHPGCGERAGMASPIGDLAGVFAGDSTGGPAGARLGVDDCEAGHSILILLQSPPDEDDEVPAVSPDPAPAAGGEWPLRSRLRVVGKPVEPPGDERQAILRLRTDVLLL